MLKLSNEKVQWGYNPVVTVFNQFSFPFPNGKDFEATIAQRHTVPDYDQLGNYFEGIINGKKVKSYIDFTRTHLFVLVNGNLKHYQISKIYSTTKREYLPLNIPIYEKALPDWAK